jgi:hypothetical protein
MIFCLQDGENGMAQCCRAGVLIKVCLSHGVVFAAGSILSHSTAHLATIYAATCHFLYLK